MESIVYNKEGREVGKIELPKRIFSAKWNADLVHQVVASMRSNRRSGTAHAKDRSETRGGGKKPWRQKGTGRARHGSRRSPIWVGGGVTHGPRSERDYSKKINKKMRARALASVLSVKLRDGELLFVDSLSINTPKTAEAAKTLKTLAGIDGYEGLVRRKNAAYIALGGESEAKKKSFRNMGNVLADEIRNMNPLDILSYKYIVLEQPDSAVDFLKKKFE